MFETIFIVGVVICVILSIVVISSPVDMDTAKIFLDDTDISSKSIILNYIGGLNSVLEKTKCTLIVMKDKINFRIAFKDVDFFIPFESIESVELYNEAQILSDDQLSSFISKSNINLFTRNKSTDSKSYIVFTYNNIKNMSTDKLILEYFDAEALANELKSIIFNHENELAVDKEYKTEVNLSCGV